MIHMTALCEKCTGVGIRIEETMKYFQFMYRELIRIKSKSKIVKVLGFEKSICICERDFLLLDCIEIVVDSNSNIILRRKSMLVYV